MGSDLNTRLTAIAKKWGEDAVLRFGDIKKRHVEAISSGCLAIDIATQVGGYPRAAITEAFGPESAGKTTLALWFLAHVQKMGGTCAFVNTEQKCDPDYIRTLISTYGGDADEILVSTPTCGEEALDIVERLIGVVDAVVLDSVADLVTQAELEADDTRANFVGIQARLITKALKRIKPKLGLSNTALLFTNQTRANIGGFGSSETTGGGRALRHAEILRLRVSMRGTAIRSSGQQVGIPCKAKVRKNQVGKPGEIAEFDIIWGKGLDLYKDTFEAGKATGVIEMTAGGYYHYNWPSGEERIRGEEAVKNVLRANPDLMEQMRAAVLEKMCSKEWREGGS